jgi:hypothetical protein
LVQYWKYEEMEEFLLKLVAAEMKENYKKLEIRMWKIDQSLTEPQLNQGFISSVQNQKYNIKGVIIDK